MLWTAISLTRLILDCTPQAPECAFAVVEKRRIAAANACAQAAGVRSGQNLAAALALLPTLTWAERAPARETAALEALSLWAHAFSSNIALSPPHGLVLETGGSIRLFGSLPVLLARMSTDLAAQGFTALLASAPTPTGARMLARSGFAVHPATPAALRAALPGLPVTCLDSAAGFASTFETLGLRTVADVLALPRDGLARRFGAHIGDELDRAMGHKPDPLRPIITPATFRSVVALPVPTESAEALQFACARAFHQLEGFLRAGKQAVDRIDLTLHHERGNRQSDTTVQQEQRLTLNFFEPSASSARFMLILRERLNHTTLAQRVERITVCAPAPMAASESTRALLPEPARADHGLQPLLERLHARLGEGALAGVAAHAEHRPGATGSLPPLDAQALRAARTAGRHAGTTALAKTDAVDLPPAWGPRPVWLIEPPTRLAEIDGKPHHEGPLTLMAGPERIESGWWDGKAITRDYFIAQTGARALVWIFRERGLPPGWFLQGYFG